MNHPPSQWRGGAGGCPLPFSGPPQKPSEPRWYDDILAVPVLLVMVPVMIVMEMTRRLK